VRVDTAPPSLMPSAPFVCNPLGIAEWHMVPCRALLVVLLVLVVRGVLVVLVVLVVLLLLMLLVLLLLMLLMLLLLPLVLPRAHALGSRVWNTCRGTVLVR
jgi:hypothetical protein